MSKIRVKDMSAITQSKCSLQIENVCSMPDDLVGPIQTYKFVDQQRQFQACRKCVAFKEKSGEWEIEGNMGRRI